MSFCFMDVSNKFPIPDINIIPFVMAREEQEKKEG